MSADRGPEILDAVARRSAALVTRDADALRMLLHAEFVWTSYAGLVLDREGYVGRNTGPVRFVAQRFEDVSVRVVGDAAVLTGVVIDELGDGSLHRMLITLTWVHEDGRWQLLAGHAGPRV